MGCIHSAPDKGLCAISDKSAPNNQGTAQAQGAAESVLKDAEADAAVITVPGVLKTSDKERDALTSNSDDVLVVVPCDPESRAPPVQLSADEKVDTKDIELLVTVPSTPSEGAGAEHSSQLTANAQPKRVQFTCVSAPQAEAAQENQVHDTSNLHSHRLLQQSLPTEALDDNVQFRTTAAGLKHIGFGPLKRENQDEFFVQVEHYGGAPAGCCYCVFDGHGTYGGNVATFCRQELTALLDQDLRRYNQSSSRATATHRDAVRGLISQAFINTERHLQQSGLNVTSSGTTASVVYQEGNKLWVAAAGDSRVITLQWKNGAWETQALTLDHRPSRRSEKARVLAAGGRVEPKRLASGKQVGEPRLWLQHIPSPGLLLSRSIGDEMASSVGCTAEPEITYMTLRPFVDCYLVIASDGVWDVLTNEQVCQLVSSAEDPKVACFHVLDAALMEWEERLAADNISVVVARFDWG
mmetsp:Transcript_39295/g.87432  ORF Transcript_39295/g.87432 Transcript_39295/m.87432 type:complete len:468 (-) Transcript_39295:944-2347(-)|eukprot:CAMPEP_0202921854 /NCGR_PEP_ID=MMETSP1392-20130828/77615_1 /ASSEMBLY_ACC=CAM_ASM_000868 /TAXON_ID=225041 /ORGANISM="Chlamydomonas chlamydogama, Strain SAG 11-48b" /LENGTH=467 /DNA_ID=CAMNT_0049615453 /DNA_START=68 /DNA_END=1471 /DNA_ORIENTATION=-